MMGIFFLLMLLNVLCLERHQSAITDEDQFFFLAVKCENKKRQCALSMCAMCIDKAVLITDYGLHRIQTINLIFLVFMNFTLESALTIVHKVIVSPFLTEAQKYRLVKTM